jgi:aspartyl protease family protein
MLHQTFKAAIALIIGIVGVVYVIGPALEEKSLPQMTSVKRAPMVVGGQNTAAKVPTPTQTQSSVRGIEYLNADSRGHFSASIEVNGANIETLVDTGASMVAFGANDAERAGIRPTQSEYKYKSQTANGEVAMARVFIPRMRLGSIELENVEAAVLPEGALNGTLLGMSFLRRLQVQTENGRMTLKQ